MAARLRWKTIRWFLGHLLWDTTAAARGGIWGALWATRKLLVAVAATGLLTWREWVEHHPPEIILITFIHFVFVCAVIALLVCMGKWFSGTQKKSPAAKPNL